MDPQEPTCVDRKIWQCLAGPSVKIPKLNSQVFYFPPGHLEHACPSPNTETLSLINGYRPIIPCLVSHVDLLADRQTDEVFVKLILTPITNDSVHEPQEPEVCENEHGGDGLVFSGKTLTQSDANNGGAFSVPSECAKLIFPPLDLQSQMPSQVLAVKDIHNFVWNFRHTYRGSPKRHLITTNWSKFVDTKKIIGGDSLVLMKNSEDKIFIGIRRHKFSAAAKITEKSVMEAAELADKNMTFEVIYYPTASHWCNFVVDAEVVKKAMQINWVSGMRVKLCLKTDESSKRSSIFQGTVSALSDPSHHPWRMLQV